MRYLSTLELLQTGPDNLFALNISGTINDKLYRHLLYSSTLYTQDSSMRKSWRFAIAYGLYLTISSPVSLATEQSLTLIRAEQLALHKAPELAQQQAIMTSLEESAIAARQLPDPKLHAGLVNVPTDTFDLDQENMTQMKVGVMQAFPKGKTRYYSGKQLNSMAAATLFKRKDAALMIKRTVRKLWLELFYWQQARSIVAADKNYFQHLVKITESLLSVGKKNQYELLRSQIGLDQLDNRLIEIDQQLNTTRAALGRWIGEAAANLSLPKRLPRFAGLPSFAALEKQLQQHPLLNADGQTIQAKQYAVALAKQQYKPGFNLDLSYSHRQGDNPATGNKRPDFVGAQVNIDLPIFPGNRQTRTVNASMAKLSATHLARKKDYLELKRQLNQAHKNWLLLNKRIALYNNKLIPKAKIYAKSTLIAYENDQTDFPTVMQAYIAELDTSLNSLRAKIDLANLRIDLLYLQGK